MVASSSVSSIHGFFILNKPPTHNTLDLLQNPHRIAFLKPSSSISFSSCIKKKPSSSSGSSISSLEFRPLFANLTESSSSDSPKESPDPTTSLLQDLVDSFNLPADYLKQLPRDLRLDLNDAAFDLSKGQVIDECGQELGDTLLNITRAWEAADTSTSTTLVGKLPFLVVSVTDSNRSAFGKRLVSSGRRFQSMGQYGHGELQKIAEALIKAGNYLSASAVSSATNEEPTQETRMFKFGDLQVELTPDKAYIGALISFGFGTLSWELSQGIQRIPESSLQYANDNPLLLTKSLLGAILAVCYSSAVLSAFATVGLVLLGGQLKSKEK